MADCNNSSISDSQFCLDLPENIFDIKYWTTKILRYRNLKAQNKEQAIPNIQPGTYTVRSRDRPRDRRAHRPLRPVRHGGARGGLEGEAAHRVALQVDVARHGHVRRGAPAALAPAGHRRGRRRGGDGAERPLRAVRPAGEETRSLESGGAALHDLARGRARAARPAAAAPRRAPGAAPLKEVGPDPVSGKPIVVKEGRFGPYVTDGETNASLRQGDDPEEMTVERAMELLADRRAARPGEEAGEKAAAAKQARVRKHRSPEPTFADRPAS